MSERVAVVRLSLARQLLRRAHDRLAGYQDRLARRRSDHPRRQLERLLTRARQCGVPDGARLDIGGGNGQYRELLHDPGTLTLVVDRFPGPGVDVVGDACELPIRSGTAGLTILVETLEHLAEPMRALSECHRVLRPHGLLAITTPQYWHNHGHPDDYYRYTDSGLRYLCERAGFTVIECWSRGGPALVAFHAIHVNLSVRWRPLFVIPFYRLVEWIDQHTYDPRPAGRHYDALGWSVLAEKCA